MTSRIIWGTLLFCASCVESASDDDVIGNGSPPPGGLSDGSVAEPSSCTLPILLDEAGVYRATVSAADAGVVACDSEATGGIFQLDLSEASWVYLDALDSHPDVNLSVRSATCDGTVVACSEAACGVSKGQLLLPLGPGRYVVVANPTGGEGGEVAVRFETSTCEATLLTPGTTLGSVGTCPGGGAGSCGGGSNTFCSAGVEESVWVLAGCGTIIQIDTCVGTGFDSVLYLRDGDCSGEELECVNSGGCGEGLDDEVLSGTLAPGMYFLFVDSQDWWDLSFSLRFQ